jgi:DNA-binding winged helix-turn-helix (wHTH) protein/tetratricopeptide (TPR) repeat protein
MTRYRFSSFEVSVETGELRSNGDKVPIQPQPFQILCLLVRRAGELVTREELSATLWGTDAFGDVDQGLNIAVKKLRDALGDSAEKPRFVETLPRRGYRFIEPVSLIDGTASTARGASGNVSVAGRGAALTAPSVRRRTRWRWLWAVACVGAALISAVLWVLQSGGDHLEFRERDVVLVAQFDNDTGDEDLTGALEYALEVELANSQYVTVAPGERVADTLRLMRQPAVSRPTASMARDICLRDPGIRAVVSGRVKKIGSRYLLTAKVLDPVRGNVLMTATEPADSKQEIVPAIRRISIQIREGLGEGLPAIRAYQKAMERVTTPSLRALKLYGESTNIIGSSKSSWQAAEVLLRQAIREDESFASAYILLARALHNQNKTASEWLPFVERAVSLADDLPEREAYFIRARYHLMRGEHDQALPYYEALLRLHPDHSLAAGEAVFIYQRMGQVTRAANLAIHLATLRPNDPETLANAGWISICLPNGADRAVAYFDRAGELARLQQRNELEQRLIPQQLRVRTFSAWMAGDLEKSRAELESARVLPATKHPIVIALAYFDLGMLCEAKNICARLKPSLRFRWLTLLNLAGDDRGAAQTSARQLAKIDVNTLSAIAILRAGLPEPAARMSRQITNDKTHVLTVFYPSASRISEGEVALTAGRTRQAIGVLEPALGPFADRHTPEYFLGSQALARAYLAQQQADKAVAVLEEASKHRTCSFYSSGFFWMQIRHDLMRLYRQLGRHAEAEEIAQDLRNLLRLADANHVLRAGLESGSPVR